MAAGQSTIDDHRLVLRFALAFALSLAVIHGAVADDAVTIRSAIDSLSRGRIVLVDGDPICASRPLPLFYNRRQFAPAWSARDRDDLLAAMRDAKNDGLEPADYHLASIERTSDVEQRDLLLTDAFFLLASHLLSGRIDPESIEPTWCLTPRANDLVAALETALELHEVRAAIARMPPAHPQYAALRRWLATLPAHRRRGRMAGGRREEIAAARRPRTSGRATCGASRRERRSFAGHRRI
jgi:hypothetical protein